MDSQGTPGEIARLRVGISDLLIRADALGLLDVGIHLEQARLAAHRAEETAWSDHASVMFADSVERAAAEATAG